MARPLRALTAGLVLGSLLLCGGVAAGQPLGALEGRGPVTLTADSLEYEAERDVYVARGHVVIVQGKRTLKADWIAFNAKTGAGVASGHVELVDGTDTLRSNFVEFDVRNLTGVIREGSLDSPGSRFRTSGAVIEKTGKNTYRFRDGIFTTCRCPKPDATDPWRIRADEAELEVGGYGTVKDATLEVLNVPVLWLPWMIYPIKTERQTGFLFPEVSIASRNGFGVGLPFFWAPRDDLDLTLTPEWTTRRGFKGAGELEYVAGRESEGKTSAAFAYDERIDPHSLDEPFGRERWVLGGDHDLHLPADLRLRTHYAFASDNQAPLDFDELSAARADRYLESVGSVSRGFGATGRFGGTVSAWYANDLQNPDDVDRDRTLLQRLPQAEVAALPGEVPYIPWLRPSLDAQYTRFDQLQRPSGGANGFVDTGVDGVSNPREILRGTGPGPPTDPDADNFNGVTGTEGDGRFEEGEPLTDAGDRVVLQPRVAAPFRLGRFAEVYPEAGWHETFYDTLEHGGVARGLLTGRVDLRSRLRRRFAGGAVHVIEPQVGWAYVGASTQSHNPLLVPATALPQERIRTLDLDAAVRDTADRIAHANRLSFGVTQRVLGAPQGDRPGALQADFTVLGLYDFEGREFGDVVADGHLAPRKLGDLRFDAGFDPKRARLDEGLAEWSWRHPDGHRVSVGYRFLRQVPNVFEDFGTGDRFSHVQDERRVEQLDGSVRIAVTRQVSASYRLAYSFASNLLLANQGMVEYLSRCTCWAAGVEVSDDRARGLEVKVLYRLIGLGKDESPNPGGLLDW